MSDNQLSILLPVWIILFMVGFMFGATLVRGEEGHPPQDQALHDQFYSKWNMPDMRDSTDHRYASCCNKIDCYPTAFKKEGDTWYARQRETGNWIAVPESKIEQNYLDMNESPDGQSHVCMSSPATGSRVICATIGSGM